MKVIGWSGSLKCRTLTLPFPTYRQAKRIAKRLYKQSRCKHKHLKFEDTPNAAGHNIYWRQKICKDCGKELARGFVKKC